MQKYWIKLGRELFPTMEIMEIMKTDSQRGPWAAITDHSEAPKFSSELSQWWQRGKQPQKVTKQCSISLPWHSEEIRCSDRNHTALQVKLRGNCTPMTIRQNAPNISQNPSSLARGLAGTCTQVVQQYVYYSLELIQRFLLRCELSSATELQQKLPVK